MARATRRNLVRKICILLPKLPATSARRQYEAEVDAAPQGAETLPPLLPLPNSTFGVPTQNGAEEGGNSTFREIFPASKKRGQEDTQRRQKQQPKTVNDVFGLLGGNKQMAFSRARSSEGKKSRTQFNILSFSSVLLFLSLHFTATSMIEIIESTLPQQFF